MVGGVRVSYIVSSDGSMSISLNEPERIKSILQNVSIILRTRQGTVPLYREFGLPMEFVDKPSNIAVPTALIEAREAIDRFESRASLTGIKILRNDKGILVLEAEVEIADEES